MHFWGRQQGLLYWGDEKSLFPTDQIITHPYPTKKSPPTVDLPEQIFIPQTKSSFPANK